MRSVRRFLAVNCFFWDKLVRAFVQLRHASSAHADLAKRLTDLELSTELLELSQDTFSRCTRNQLRQMFETLRELVGKVTPVESPSPPKRSTGFLPLDDNPKASEPVRGKKTG